MMKYFPIGCCLGKNNERDEDRISDLPDSIIHHILKFLEMKDVVQTSLLSKRWRYVWKSHPYLNFYSNFFSSEETQRFEGFLDFVGKVINFRDNSSNIQSFHLTHISYDDPSDLNTWILIALRSKVEDLYLNVYRQDFFRDYLPHECLFTCKSLRKLELDCSDGNGPTVLKLPDLMSLPEVKTLVLRGFRFEYSESMDNNIFSCSRFPVLESLVLYGCTFHRTSYLDISSTQLKHLVIINHLYLYYVNMDHGGDEYPIKLCAPNLLTFICKDRFLLRDYSIENVSALVRTEIGLGTDEVDRDVVPYVGGGRGRLYSQQMVKFLSAVHNVETLTLRAPFLKAISGDNTVLESTSIQFCNLRCLKLETWLSVDCMNSITYLLNISPNLESIFLDILREDRAGNSPPIESVLDEVHWESELTLHRLKDVEIQGALGCHNELMFMEILLKKAMVLESVTLYTPKKQQSPYFRPLTKEQREKIVEQLLALPRASSSIKFTIF